MMAFETHPSGGSQTFHFYVSLIDRGITILASMGLELKYLSDSELIT